MAGNGNAIAMTIRSVYLAGPIHGRNDAECKQWRHTARTFLHLAGFSVVDPTDRDFRGIEEENCIEIVFSDKDAIQKCGVVLVNACSPSWGTAMECLYASQFGKVVIGFATYSSSPSISPWLRCHTTSIYESLGRAIDGIVHGSVKGMR